MGPPPHSPDGGRGRPVQSREIRVPPAGPRGERVSVAAVRLCAPATRLVLPGRPVVNAARRGISRNSRVAGGPPAREHQPQGCSAIGGSAAGRSRAAMRRTQRMRLAAATATLAVFDPTRLRHRVDSPADWWTWAPDVLADLNAGNVLPVDVASDGLYAVTVHLDEDRPPAGTEAMISGLVGCDSGVLFVGPGEQISGGGLEPDEGLGGVPLPSPPGTYRVSVARDGDDGLEVWLEPAAGPPANAFTDYPRL